MMTKRLKRLWILLSIMLTPCAKTLSQIFPADGSTLNYRIIGFTFPESPANKYKLEIAYGNFNDTISFKNNIRETFNLNTNRIVAEVPEFGKVYTWRVSSQKKISPLYHFATGFIRTTDTSLYRLKIKHKAEKYKDHYVFLDATHCLYDMCGNVVWYLPSEDSGIRSPRSIRDIKCSPQATITFIKNENIYEIDYSGKELWSGPGNRKSRVDKTSANYHHQFDRLKNGHYMTAGTQYISYFIDTINKKITYNGTEGLNKEEFGNVIEYNDSGKEIWRWNAANYFTNLKAYNDDLLYGDGRHSSTHENAFFLDEKRHYLYVSFRNINEILKIKYPEGKVEGVYGAEFHDPFNKSPFLSQHACNISSDGRLYLFNNNIPGKQPNVIIFDKPENSKGNPSIYWQYQYPFDKAFPYFPAETAGILKAPTSGGNVKELKAHDMFVSYCEPYPLIFIVDKHKKLLWDASSERLDSVKKTWYPYSNYRASIISRQQLEKLIWNSQP